MNIITKIKNATIRARMNGLPTIWLREFAASNCICKVKLYMFTTLGVEESSVKPAYS